jgi:hypothetical protein
MADRNELTPVYANFVRIAHGPIAFLVDFKQLGPESPKPEEAPAVARVVLHPAVAKAFAEALQDNLRKFEEQFGKIPPLASGKPSIVH